MEIPEGYVMAKIGDKILETDLWVNIYGDYSPIRPTNLCKYTGDSNNWILVHKIDITIRRTNYTRKLIKI